LDAITYSYEQIIVDGDYNFFADDPRSSALIGADNSVPAVSAASIVAKVARDKYMADAALQFPGYGFERHVGYGTAAHSLALKTLGITELHRRSFKPIQAFVV
jgi:ribonuclease HII